MALETLKGVESIGGFKVGHMDDAIELTKEEFEANGNRHVVADHNLNAITFFIQNGPIKENGVNGCQVDTLIQTSLLMVKKLNEKFPCAENEKCIGALSTAIGALNQRKNDRQKRGVEGTNQA